MISRIKKILKRVLPEKLVTLIYGLRPEVYSADIFHLRIDKQISELHPIDTKFYIRELDVNDTDRLTSFYILPKYILPRLNKSAWIGLAAIDKTCDKVAYISWILKENIKFVHELDVDLKNNQFMVIHGYCHNQYRHQGLHTRMEQERIKWIFKNGGKEIFLHIGSKNKKGIDGILKVGWKFMHKKYIIRIAYIGIYRELYSFLKNPFKRAL